jgi:hypothetical protein
MLWSSSPTQVSRPFRSREVFQQPVLRAVGVLALVHQQVADALAPRRRQLRILFQQLQRQADQVVEVDALKACRPRLVARVQRRRLVLARALRQFLGLRRRQAFVLHLGNQVAQRVDRVLLRIRRRQVLDDAVRVVAVEDGEAAAQPARALSTAGSAGRASGRC